MAYINQEQKKEISTLLKTFVPKSWKWSLKIVHHSKIVMTIRKSDTDLIAEAKEGLTRDKGYLQVNTYILDQYFKGVTAEIFEKINNALNLNNFDKSDIQSDYFHVGHYTGLHIGEWDKPFICTK